MLFIIFVITVSLPFILCSLDEIEALVKATKVATEYVLRPVGWLVDEITWILDAQAICRFEDLLEGEIPLGDLEDEDIYGEKDNFFALMGKAFLEASAGISLVDGKLQAGIEIPDYRPEIARIERNNAVALYKSSGSHFLPCMS